MQLRPYQNDVIDAVRAELQRGHKRILVVLPTGGGKTEIFTHIARRYTEAGYPTLVTVHRNELLIQTSRRVGADHGLIAAGFTPNPTHDLQVGMIQTLARRGTGGFKLILEDECHHAPANTNKKVREHNPDATVIGFTATPLRGDGQGLGDFYDVMVEGPTCEWLTQQGYLAPAKVYRPSTINTRGIGVRYGEFKQRELQGVADTSQVTGCAVSHYRKYADGKRTLVATVSIEHAVHVAERFCAAGYRFKAVHGGMSQGERDDAIGGLAALDYHGLVYCELFSEGVDCPVVECGIFLRPTQSLGLWDQQVGRIKRPSPGKDYAILLDHAGNSARFGIAEWGREWTLEKGKKRVGQGEALFKTRTCPVCFGVHRPSPVCPYCDHEYVGGGRVVEEVDGELEEMTAEEIARQRARARHVLSAVGQRFERRLGQ
jgi:superfamily II DNA or RNA helicase